MSCCAEHYPLPTLKAFASLFPDASLSTFIRGFLQYFALEDPPAAEEGEARPSKRRQKEAEQQVDELAVESEQDMQDQAFQLLLVS